MKVIYAVLAATVLACFGCKPTPSEPVEASVADVLAAVEAQTPETIQIQGPVRRPPRATGFVPANPDTRSRADFSAAACWGFDDSGQKKWRCSKKPAVTLMSAGQQPIIPSSWTVPLWVLDPANSTGCASDNNPGITVSCAGGGGPLLTMNELIRHRWGQSNPQLQQTTDIWPISSETVGQERIFPLNPIMVKAGSNFELICTPTNIGTSFAAGVVTAVSRVNPGNDLKIATMPAGAAKGVIVQNITHPSYAIIHSMSGATATMDQPLNGTTVVGIAGGYGENNSWTTGDTLQLLQPCLLNLTSEGVQITDTNAAGSQGIAWNSMLHVPDISGVNGNSTTILTGIGTAYWGMSVFDSLVNVTNNAGALATAYSMVGCQFNGGVVAQGISVSNFTAIAGGDVATNFNAIQNGEMYADTIVTGFIQLSGQSFVSGHVSAGATLDVVEGVTGVTQGSGGFSIGLWGAGTLIAKAGASFLNGTGGTWVNNVQVATLNLADAVGNAQTTGTSYAAGVWTDGVTINPTTLDANNGGLQNPRTGARFARQ